MYMYTHIMQGSKKMVGAPGIEFQALSDIYTYRSVYIGIFIHMHTYIFIYIYIHTYIHIYRESKTRLVRPGHNVKRSVIYIYYMYIHMFTYIYMHIYVYIYTCM